MASLKVRPLPSRLRLARPKSVTQTSRSHRSRRRGWAAWPRFPPWSWTAPAQQEVGRFDVAVADLIAVGVVDGPGRGGKQPGRLARLGNQLGQALGQAAVDQLHDAERQPPVFADRVQGHDVGVLKLGGVACLIEQTPDVRWRRPAPRREHLQGHFPVESHIPGPVDNACTAPAEDAADLIPLDLRPALRRGQVLRGKDGCP